MTLELNRVRAVVKIHVRAKYHQLTATVHQLVYASFSALSRNGEKSENPVL